EQCGHLAQLRDRWPVIAFGVLPSAQLLFFDVELLCGFCDCKAGRIARPRNQGGIYDGFDPCRHGAKTRSKGKLITISKQSHPRLPPWSGINSRGRKLSRPRLRRAQTEMERLGHWPRRSLDGENLPL